MFSFPLAGLVFFFFFLFKSVAGLHNVTIQENDPRIRYSDASWTHVSDLSDKPSLLGCSDGITQNAVRGSFFEFNFTGTAVYLNTIDGVQGTFKAILDDKPFDFNSGNATTARCQIAYSQTGLADGPHRLVILNAGSPSSMLFDSITYTESDPYDYGNPPAGSIPHNNAPSVYVPVRPQSSRVTPSGSWQVVDLTPIGESIRYCADYVFQTTTIGSYIEFRFNGTGVEVNTLADPHSRGLMIMSIDGQNEVVDGRGSPGDCKLAWNRKGLSPNVEHVLRVINAGPSVLDETSLVSIASIKYSTTSDDPSVQDPNNNVPGLRPLPAYIPYEDLPTNPAVIGGAVAAGVFVLCFLAFIFYWARRDRLKQAAARKLDEEKAISGRNHKKRSAGGLTDERRTPRQPKQTHVVVVPPPADYTPRSSITLGDFRSGSISSDGSRPSTRQSGRKVGFLEPPNPSRS